MTKPTSAAAKRITASMRLHEFVHALSGNPLIETALETNLTATQRVMGEVLIRDEKPRDIWDQHAEILEATAKGDGDKAEALVRGHLIQAVQFMVNRLRDKASAA